MRVGLFQRFLVFLAIILCALMLLIGLSVQPAHATACTVHFFTVLGGGTNATYDLYSDPHSYVVYSGSMQAELPYWWGGPGIPGYGIAFEVGGGCTTLRVASVAWHVAGDTGHYWEAWTGGSHNAEGDANLSTQIPIDTDFAGYDLIAGNLAHGNPYDYVTFVLYTTEGDPGPTVTPTLLYTPAVTGTPGAATTQEACPSLGDSNALFQFDMEWAGYYTEFYDATNLVSLVLHPGSFATLTTTLKASRRYAWQMVFMTPATGATGPLNLSAGDQDFAIDLFNDTSDHTQTNQAIQLGTEPIELRLDRPVTASGDVVIRYLCFTPEGDSVTQPTDSETGKADDCMLCDPPMSIADIIGLLNWLVCNIRNVIICVIIPALGEVLKYLVLSVQYALSFFTWLVQAASDAVTWVAEVVVGFFQNLGGQVSNAIFGSNNALITSGAAGLLNQTASTARDLPTILANEANRLGTDLSNIFENSRSLPELVINLIGFAANLIMTVLGLIPLALQSLFDGLASSAEPVSGGLMCSTPDTTLYFPCLGFYILDNTFFQGPARFLIPVLMGVVMLDMLTWAIAAIREAFVK